MYSEIDFDVYDDDGNETNYEGYIVTNCSEAVAINASDQAIVSIGNGESVIFYDIETGNIETLAPLAGADEIHAVAINDEGNVAGTSGDDAFFWKNGNMTICGNLCENQADGSSLATAINNSNQVVGYATNDDGEVHAFIWQYTEGESVITDLGTLGGANSWAVAINDNGIVIGYSETGETYAAGSLETDVHHACAWYAGSIYDLGVTTDFIEADNADFPFSMGVAINNSDRIAGNSFTINDFSRGFIVDTTLPK